MKTFHKNGMTNFLSLLLCVAIAPAIVNAQETEKAEKKVEQKKTETAATTATSTSDEPEVKEVSPGYDFEIEARVDCTSVKNQGRTGTCWCFASTSFIESEMMRAGKGELDLSEMFVVRNIYHDKANNYLLRSGATSLGEGALAHDYIRAASEHGLVPNSVYSGLVDGATTHNHAEMFSVMEGVIKTFEKQRSVSDKWSQILDRVMDIYVGEAPTEFSYQGETYTPKSFAKHLGFNADDYVNLTSYTHHPFGRPFALEIPDNFSSGQFDNMPIDDLVAAIDNAIANGYSVAWDGDVSERGFSRGNGLALLPKNPSRRDLFTVRGEELDVSQEMRQKTFLSHSTTDDHLMHLVGIARDAEGKKYYLIKNSWGEVGDHGGYLYMSEAYVRLKTVAVLMHKDAVPVKNEAKEAKPTT